MISYTQSAVNQWRSSIRVILMLSFISTSGRDSKTQAIIRLMQQIVHLQQWLFICHHNPSGIQYTLDPYPVEKLILLISTPSIRVKELIIQIVCYSVYWMFVLHHIYCTLYGVCSLILFIYFVGTVHPKLKKDIVSLTCGAIYPSGFLAFLFVRCHVFGDIRWHCDA